MKLHEYEAKGLLKSYQIPIPKGFVASSAEVVSQQLNQLGAKAWFVKAQVHAGGRGKAGGIRLVHKAQEVAQVANELIGSQLVTKQTDAQGLTVYDVLVEEAVSIKKEIYISILFNKEKSQYEIIASPHGGINVEESVLTKEDNLIREQIPIQTELPSFIARRIAYKLVETSHLQKQLTRMIKQMHRLFLEKDCTMIEINPLVITDDQALLALDAKISIDSSALFRQQDLIKRIDHRQKNELEQRAERQGLSYVHLGGEVACMVNGAGLAMATMDAIYHAGLQPANFLDIGGAATEDGIAEALSIIIANQSVQVIFVNVFGGIVRCDLIAKSIIKAAQEIGFSVPIVIRLEGTNVQEARVLLEKSNITMHSVVSLKEGIKKLESLIK